MERNAWGISRTVRRSCPACRFSMSASSYQAAQAAYADHLAHCQPDTVTPEQRRRLDRLKAALQLRRARRQAQQASG